MLILFLFTVISGGITSIIAINKAKEKPVWILITVSFLLLFTSIILSERLSKRESIGKPATIDVLKDGEKYEVFPMEVAEKEKYVIVKSIGTKDELRLIGLLDSGTITAGICIKTSTGTLEKIK